MHITLLHTNDLHGRLRQLTRIAALVKEIKQNAASEGAYCVYLDGGDSEDTILLESSLTKGSVMGSILRAAGCDVMTLGNAIPVRYGVGVLEAEAANFGWPILCGNLFYGDGSPIAGLEPWRVLQFGGLKAAVIGLTAPSGAYPGVFGLKMLQPLEAMPALVDKVRGEGAQLVIALNHIGSSEDARLAQAVDGIDVIIGGHDHKAITPPNRVNGCLIVQAGEHGKFLGRLDLDVDETTERVLSAEGELIPISDEMLEDQETIAAIESEKRRAEAMMAHVVGRVEVPLDLAFDRECAAGNLLADALLTRFADAQFSFVLAGQWNEWLPAGEISAGMLFSANRSSANPARVTLSGEQVLAFLKNALKPENAARELHSLRGGKVGWPHVSGLDVKWDGKDVDSLQVFYQGQPLDPQVKYIVSATDMEFADFVGYLVIPDAEVSYEVPTIMPEVLQDYINANTPIQAVPGGRIQII
jgi:2',3'-cyclic-nucleotide 2'-phosphodiesterase (5'-nucleotidase family)